jgi:hypothetical protein
MAGLRRKAEKQLATCGFGLSYNNQQNGESMKTLRLGQALISTVSVLATTAACAHPGGQDRNGGHVKRATGEYHCHQPDFILPTVVGEPDYEIFVASFNIQWAGNSPNRDNTSLGEMLSRFEVVADQQVVSSRNPRVMKDNAR